MAILDSDVDCAVVGTVVSEEDGDALHGAQYSDAVRQPSASSSVRSSNVRSSSSLMTSSRPMTYEQQQPDDEQPYEGMHQTIKAESHLTT